VTTLANGKQPQEVRVIWTSRRVRLIERGPEASEVQFLDTGTGTAISNEQLEFFAAAPSVPRPTSTTE
jgi:hypothetical protein